MKRPNAASLILVGFSLGILTTASAGTLGSAVFGDVPSGSYFDSAVGDMYSAGIITGYDSGKFGPNDYVTRGQVAVMLQRFKNSITGTVSSAGRSSVSSSVSSVSSVSSDSSDPSASIEPTNNTEGSFRFTTGSYKVDENEGTVTISIIRYGGNTGSVSVDYETKDSSATSGSDYTVTSGTLTFEDGKTSGTFTIPIIDDNEAEETETVMLILKNPGGGGSLGSPIEATLSIIDDDEGNGSSADKSNAKGVFIFSASEYEMAEDLGKVRITISRTSGTTGAVSVNFATLNGTADSSYYDSNSGTLDFADGESSKGFDVNIKDNKLTNGNKTVILKLSAPTGGATLGSLSTSTLVIVDNEVSGFGIGRLKLKHESQEVFEGDIVIFTIDRLGGSKGDITVDYTTSNSLAKADEDYTPISGTLTFKEGESQKLLSVHVLHDDKNDPRETFKFEIKNPTGGATLETPSISTVTIQ